MYGERVDHAYPGIANWRTEDIWASRRMKGLPTISIAVPSFNHGPYVEETIKSILDQHYPGLELLIMDGGSTDETAAILRRYSRHFAFWRSERDAGQTTSLIEAFGMATGDLLGWVNSDDILLPNALRHVAERYRRNPEAGLIGGNFILIDAAGGLIRCKRHPAHATMAARLGVMAVHQPGSFFTRAAYRSVGGLDPRFRYIMDTDLYLRMLLAGVAYAYVGRWMSAFRQHGLNVGSMDPAGAASETHSMLGSLGLPRQGLRPLFSRMLYRLWQTGNANYLRMAVETEHARGVYWRTWAAAHC